MAAALVASAPASIMRAPGEPVVEGKRHAGLVPSRDEIRCHQLKNDGLKRHVFVLQEVHRSPAVVADLKFRPKSDGWE